MKRTKRSRSLAIPEKTDVRTGSAEEDGVVLLLWWVETPFFDAAFGKTGAASFYGKIARKSEEYLTGRLAERLRAEYLASDPARRRFAFRPAVYSHAARCAMVGGALTVERTVSFTRAGRVLFSRVFSERWDPADGSFLPSPDGGRQKGGKSPEKSAKKAPKKVDGGACDML